MMFIVDELEDRCISVFEEVWNSKGNEDEAAGGVLLNGIKSICTEFVIIRMKK